MRRRQLVGQTRKGKSLTSTGTRTTCAGVLATLYLRHRSPDRCHIWISSSVLIVTPFKLTGKALDVCVDSSVLLVGWTIEVVLDTKRVSVQFALE